MTVVALIQARMGSSRLPGKVMLPLAGTPVVTHETRRALAVDGIDEVVIATSTKPRDEILVDQARRMDVTAHRGPEADVLGRLAGAARAAEAEVVVRLPGDNPLVPPPLVEAVLDRVRAGDAAVATNKLDRTFPIGITAEAITREALDRLDRDATDAFHREHVSTYVTEHAAEFETHNVTVADVYGPAVGDSLSDVALTDLRLTLDRAPDYELLHRVCDSFADPVPSFEDVLELIAREGLASINADVDQEVL